MRDMNDVIVGQEVACSLMTCGYDKTTGHDGL